MNKTKDPDQCKSRLEWLEEGSAAPEVEERLRNLCVLAVGLKQLSEWPEYSHFDMRDYALELHPEQPRSDGYILLSPDDVYGVEPSVMRGECNTVACALGHGPMFGIRPASSTVLGRNLWFSYASKFIDYGTNAHEWFFSGAWAHVEGHDTPLGAAKRIAYWLGSNDVRVDHRIVDFMLEFTVMSDDDISTGNYIAGRIYNDEEEALQDLNVEMDALGFEGIIARMKAVLTEEQLTGIAWTDWEAQEKDLQKFTVKNHE